MSGDSVLLPWKVGQRLLEAGFWMLNTCTWTGQFTCLDAGSERLPWNRSSWWTCPWSRASLDRERETPRAGWGCVVETSTEKSSESKVGGGFLKLQGQSGSGEACPAELPLGVLRLFLLTHPLPVPGLVLSSLIALHEWPSQGESTCHTFWRSTFWSCWRCLISVLVPSRSIGMCLLMSRAVDRIAFGRGTQPGRRAQCLVRKNTVVSVHWGLTCAWLQYWVYNLGIF